MDGGGDNGDGEGGDPTERCDDALRYLT
jgi:hypothetical protein